MNEAIPFATIDNTQEIVSRVVQKVTQAVASTMGPDGKLALIAIGTGTKTTKDGVTVAKALRFNDPREELVNKIIVEPAIKTDLECGDGTTTTILLTGVLYQILKNHQGFMEQKFIEKLINLVIQKLTALAISIEVDDPRLYDLALTSSNNDEELSRLITEIYAKSGGKFPEIEIKEGIDSKDKVVSGRGLPINMMFSNPVFSQFNNGADTTYNSFYPIIVDENIRAKDLGSFQAILKELHTRYDQQTPILIIARSIEQDYNSLMAHANASIPTPHFVGIQTNMGGSVGTLLMQDIATIFGVPLFSRIEDVTTHVIPVVNESITVGNSRTLLGAPSIDAQERIQKRVQSIQNELSSYDMGERFSMRARFNEKRIRNLNGQLVTIFVGGETSSEVKERVDRFEDVIKAVKSALVNGILPGIGVSLMKAVYLAVTEAADLVTTSTEIKIVDQVVAGMMVPYLKLTKGIVTAKDMDLSTGEWVEPEAVNLATGVRGTAESLGVYDTAFASITALKGGFQTAKILSNAQTLLLGDKLSAVKIQS